MIKIKDCEIKENVSLKDFCTFKIGGNAKFLFVCNSTLALIDACKFCITKNIKFKVIGFGANLLFDDMGFDGAIIVNRSCKIVTRKNALYIDSGTPISTVINKCFMRELAGIDCLAGIPATVGGGVVNSLGSGDTNLYDYVEWVEAYELPALKKKRILNIDCQFGYRTSIFKSINFLITKVKLVLPQGNRANIRVNIINAIDKKIKNQPLDMPSAGSVFKRSTIIPAKVIDELSFKGKSCGDAMVSKKHAGFIVNNANATSKDVKTLISSIKSSIYSRFKVVIEEEIEFVDF